VNGARPRARTPWSPRAARRADVPAIAELVEASIRGLGALHYDARQIDASLRHVFGVDTRMIDDGTYLVVEDAGRVVGAGGWSARRTPFGGDRAGGVRDARLRDPARDPAVLRAFYVHPARARRGIGRALLAASETAARAAGFRRFELVATRSGLPLYAAAGYVEREPLEIPLGDGLLLEAVRMEKPGAPDTTG
jgi:GNAT superfamily N-acetyltransferase